MLDKICNGLILVVFKLLFSRNKETIAQHFGWHFPQMCKKREKVKKCNSSTKCLQ